MKEDGPRTSLKEHLTTLVADCCSHAPPPHSCEQFLALLEAQLQEAQDPLVTEGWEGEPPPSRVYPHLLLWRGALALMEWRARNPSPKPLEVLVRHSARPRYGHLAALVQEIAQSLWLSVESLDGDVSAFETLGELALDFQKALQVRDPGQIFRQPSHFFPRLQAFLGRRDLSDDEVRAEAHKNFTAAGLTAQEAEDLAARFPPSRLRLFPETEFATIAGHYATWGALVRYLENRSRRPNPALEQKLAKLIKELISRLGKKPPKDPGEEEQEAEPEDTGYAGQKSIPAREQDAVIEALLKVMDPTSPPGQRYRFEGDFLKWLLAVAKEIIRKGFNDWNSQPPSEPEEEEPAWGPTGGGPYDPQDPFTQRQLLEVYRERYLLVESFFDDPRRVRIIFQGMLEELNDGEILRHYYKATGDLLNLNTLSTTKRRLRQRLAVLRYLHDLVPEGWPDFPGDEAVLAWVGDRYGCQERDIPTLRQLAALARAGHSPLSLGWALAARLLVEKRSEESFEGFRTRLAPFCPSSLNENELGRAWEWWHQSGHAEKIQRLTASAREQGLRFFLPAVWLLTVVAKLSPSELTSKLKPGSVREERWLQEAGKILTKGRNSS